MTPLIDRFSSFHLRGIGLLIAMAALGGLAWQVPPASSQRIVKKIDSLCPLGYVDMLNGKCSTLGLITHTVQSKEGKSCPMGWEDVGGGYCRKK